MFKKSIATILALLLVTITLAQTPSNADFENWANPPSKPYQNPVGWSTSNDIVGDFGLTNVTKVTSPVQSGSAAAKLQSISIFGLSTAPGLVGIVSIDPLNQSLKPGAAFTSRPDSITGFFQYVPGSGDNFLVLTLLTKWNGTSRDTVGSAIFVEADTINVYKRFSIPVQYANTSMPDSLLFIVSSSAALDNAVPGSKAFVDNINFIGGTTDLIHLNLMDQINLYPNPSNEYITVQGLSKPMSLQIINAQGQVLKSQFLNAPTQQIYVSDLPQGVYILKGDGISKQFLVTH